MRKSENKGMDANPRYTTINSTRTDDIEGHGPQGYDIG